MALNQVFVELIVYAIVVIGTIASARLLLRPKRQSGLAPEPALARISAPEDAGIGMIAPAESPSSSAPEPAADAAINVPVPPPPEPPVAAHPTPAPFSAPREPHIAAAPSVESAPPVAQQPSAPVVEQAESDPATDPVGDEHPEEESHQPPEMAGQMDELEAFVDESIRVAIAHNCRPTVFMWMRQEHGTQNAISRLVRFGDDQSGFRRLTELGLEDWSIEAAVLKFPDLFDQHDRAFAEFRLAQARRQHASTRGGNESQGFDPAET